MAYQLEPDEDDIALANDRIQAPFTAEQVTELASWQRWGSGARAKCPQHPDPMSVTVSTEGYRCTTPDCAFIQDWAYGFVLGTKYCTKDEPYALAGDQKEHVVHVNAVNADPEYEGEIILMHCPNCDLTFDVDLR